MFDPGKSESGGSSGSHLPLRPALRGEDEGPCSPKSGPVKVVSIAEPEEIPLSPPATASAVAEESSRIKQFPASVSARRMTGRPIMPSNSSSRLSLVSQSSLDDYDAPLSMTMTSRTTENHAQKEKGGEKGGERKREHHVHQHDKLLMQVSEWLQREKAKRAAKKSNKHNKRNEGHAQEDSESNTGTSSRARTSSQSSNSSAISLERLQRILEDNMGAFGHELLPATSPYLGPRRPSHLGRRRASSIRKVGSSDTEYQDGDVVVPSCDVVLDNSKTLSYSGGTESSSETVTLSTSKRAEKERKAWLVFKTEIVKLAHTLRLKGWRRVPLENGGDIEVERLSGALTNAVYVVAPPRELPLSNKENGAEKQRYKPPPKLLLRIYGPQVEHLIDRENELGILRRLARKKIGPRLLGTFTNGRFEEFFNAQTLTADDLRVQDTSKQIAKRMRELHDGIDLLEREREEGPFVWQNWDKWVGRCEEVISYLDGEILSGKKGKESWRSRGLVCGVEWKFFKATVDKYRKWLDEFYKNVGGVSGRLVFAHNDTQYGNILRLLPPPPTAHTPPSPLLLPQNTHKQLVVIDFEYASANTPGLEFANHFTEWCYDYHSKAAPFACNTAKYPTLEEQRRFVRSYVNHRPQFNPRASATPKMNAMDGLAKGSISEFLLDSRMPGGSTTSLNEGMGAGYAEDEARREKEVDRTVEELLREIRIWRVANSAQWVAWGIVQADVPGLDDSKDSDSPPAADLTSEPEKTAHDHDSPHHDEEFKGTNRLAREHLDAVAGEGDSKEGENGEGEGEAEEEEFDYLGYARERALFFWGDVVSLGLVSREELLVMGGEEGEKLVRELKIVDF